MNTQVSQDQTIPFTIGKLLRQSREILGLTQKNIAEQLCLKISIIRDIEEDNIPIDLSSTFLRGYIRSYAKIVYISEDNLISYLEQQIPLQVTTIAPMRRFSLGKKNKKTDSWLIMFTWLVVFIVLGITGSWLWQNHKSQQEDIAKIVKKSSAQIVEHSKLEPSNFIKILTEFYYL
ncbi:cytoskeleton protein RodZ [Candidatus Profftia lariciata]|uniref:cytoskeleton protein RodZ n=1 Tax=Candidatus Profftia lariciata TaxID=1987921 RepID=UPI001D01DC3D|nr:cytoskeleton protein RodZ [Candidatus Profftia lariciata]